MTDGDSHSVDAQRLRIRINIAADARETRPLTPLGVGYYQAAQRERAVRLAASMLAGAEQHGLTLDDLDDVTDLAVAALEAIASIDQRTRRTSRA